MSNALDTVRNSLAGENDELVDSTELRTLTGCPTQELGPLKQLLAVMTPALKYFRRGQLAAAHEKRPRQALLYLLLGIFAPCLTACQLYPRMTLLEQDGPKQQHVIARFLRSENRFSGAKLAQMLEGEFVGHKPSELSEYIVKLGGECQRTLPSLLCIYKNQTPYRGYRPSGPHAPAATIDGIATEEIRISASTTVEEQEGLISGVNVSIRLSASVTNVELLSFP